jgi:ABC-type transport system involved in multi-copper enzyme maturation permease subunit
VIRATPLRLLIEKELRQHTRRRGALIATLVAPGAILLFQAPGTLLAATRATGPRSVGGVDSVLFLVLPLLVAVSGFLIPSVATAASISSERERNALELLIALPVTAREILTAKVASNVVLAVAILFPLVAVDAVIAIAGVHQSAAYVASLFAIGLGAIAYSCGASQLITVFARDYRTANQFTGLLIVPGVVVAVVLMLALTRFGFGIWAAAVALLAIGVASLAAGLRWLTFERYLA